MLQQDASTLMRRRCVSIRPKARERLPALALLAKAPVTALGFRQFGMER
jgi:hypothetical protein